VTSTLPDLAPALSAVLDKHADRLDLDLIDRALRFSASAHRGQKRMSGEDCGSSRFHMLWMAGFGPV
jgi:hypothetical protein